MSEMKPLLLGTGRKLLRFLRPVMSDQRFLRRYFYCKTGYPLHLDHPVTFNEKLQWLKFYDRNPRYTAMVDKVTAKDYVAAKIGSEYIIPTLAVYDQAEDIGFDALPKQFVLKCTHDSGGVVLCKDKASLDKDAALAKLSWGLKRNYYRFSLEYPYKNVRPRIIAEPFVTDAGKELCDYKVHCFNGVPRLVLVCKDRYAFGGLTEDFFTETWEHLPVRRPDHPNAKEAPLRPPQLDELLVLSRKLSEGIPFVRVDFYLSDDHIYFGELTFFPASGMSPFVPQSFDVLFGSWLELPNK